ncbi:MAG TPA: cupin [Bacillales bacterium]|nr:cupin [Bacillales bacterium]
MALNVMQFTREKGKSIDRFGSDFVMSRILEHHGDVHIACIHLEAKERIGYHDAVVSQLFLVAEGEGWVCGENDVRVPIQAGQAAFWEKGEGHGAGTGSKMTAIVIESDGLDPEMIMAEKLS